MADQFVQVPADSTGKKIDTSELTVGVNTVERQRVVIADSATAAALSTVLNCQPAGTEYGLVVREAQKGQQTMANSRPVALASDQSAVPTALQAQTSGGCSIYHVVSAASTNAANIKASAGQVFGWRVFNNASYPVYVKLYNKATSPTVGTDTPVQVVGVQAGTSADGSFDLGLTYGTGISIGITQGIADADATAVALSDCVVDVFYK